MKNTVHRGGFATLLASQQQPRQARTPPLSAGAGVRSEVREFGAFLIIRVQRRLTRQAKVQNIGGLKVAADNARHDHANQKFAPIKNAEGLPVSPPAFRQFFATRPRNLSSTGRAQISLNSQSRS